MSSQARICDDAASEHKTSNITNSWKALSRRSDRNVAQYQAMWNQPWHGKYPCIAPDEG